MINWHEIPQTKARAELSRADTARTAGELGIILCDGGRSN